MSRLATASRGLAVAVALLVSACSSQLSPPQPDPNAMTAEMSAAEIRAEFEHVKSVTPLPAGAGWKPVIIDDGWYGQWGGGSMVEFQALCAWLREAADAAQEADAARLATADEVLADIPSWRTFSDPALMDPTSRAFVLGLIDHARRREFGEVGRYLTANCRA